MSRSTEEKRRRILSSPFSHHFSFVEREEASKTRCSTLSGTRFGAALSTRSPPPSPSPSLLALALSSQSGAQGQEAQEGTTEGRDGGKAADRSQYRLVVHGEGHSQAQAHLGERERGSVHGAALHEPVHVSLFFFDRLRHLDVAARGKEQRGSSEANLPPLSFAPLRLSFGRPSCLRAWIRRPLRAAASSPLRERVREQEKREGRQKQKKAKRRRRPMANERKSKRAEKDFTLFFPSPLCLSPPLLCLGTSERQQWSHLRGRGVGWWRGRGREKGQCFSFFSSIADGVISTKQRRRQRRDDGAVDLSSNSLQPSLFPRLLPETPLLLHRTIYK